MKRTKLNKKRKVRSQKEILHDRALIIFRKWIRERDKVCVSCLFDPKITKKGLAENDGHFWHNCLDFDEENNNGQCVMCNKWKSGNLAPYSVYLLNKLGKERFDALDKRHIKALSGEYRTEQDYLDIIEKYTKLLTD